MTERTLLLVTFVFVCVAVLQKPVGGVAVLPPMDLSKARKVSVPLEVTPPSPPPLPPSLPRELSVDDSLHRMLSETGRPLGTQSGMTFTAYTDPGGLN